MSLREAELTVGRRVMVPVERVRHRYPWAQRYGSIVGVDRYLDCPPWVSVLLDGEGGCVLTFRLEELEVE